MSEITDKTTLSYWFPKLQSAGIPVPKTIIIAMPNEVRRSIFDVFDCKPYSGPSSFFDELKAAARSLGFPCFLRTGQTSDKHSWKDTCYVAEDSNIFTHVVNLVGFSECADFIGIPWVEWVLREFLPTLPMGTCPHYGDMPVCREFRFFVKNGKVKCWHPYWPLDALEDGGWRGDYAALCRMDNEAELVELVELAERAGAALGESWSIDLLETERGWFVTDLAEAHKSFHWEGCEKT